MLPFYLINNFPILKNRLRRMYADRALQIIPRISPYLSDKDKILDIGCGTGVISKHLRKKMDAQMTLTDVQFNSICDEFPVVIYDGKKLPFRDNVFDAALLIAVLHHTHDPLKIIDEALRVTKGRVIIMEDVFTDIVGRVVTLIGDCLVNWEIHSPFKNNDKEGWVNIFKKKKLNIEHVDEFKLRCIGFPFKLAIFVVSKKSPSVKKGIF